MVNMGIPWGLIQSIFSFLLKRYKKLTKYYHVIWKKPDKIKKEDLLDQRPFHNYYYSSEVNKQIANSIDKRENVLIIGKPLAGKSRTIYETLKLINNPFSVSIIRIKDINEDDFLIPIHFKLRKKNKLIIIDNLHSFVEKDNFSLIIEKFRNKKCIIIAGCRSGFDFKRTKHFFINRLGSLDVIFPNVYQIKEVDSAVAKNIAEKTGISWEGVRSKFDGTIGSIFMNLEEMWRRFSEGEPIEKTILRELKKINELGLFVEMNVIPFEWIKLACRKQDLDLEQYKWEAFIESLEEKEFLKLKGKSVVIEEVYLEQVVRYVQDYSKLDLFNEMKETFADEPKALYKMGNKARIIWEQNPEQLEYLDISTLLHEDASKKFSLPEEGIDLAMNMSNLAGNYSTCGIINRDLRYLEKSISEYEETLVYFNPKDNLLSFYSSMINIASTYAEMSYIENSRKIWEEAVTVCQKVLLYIKKENYPQEYASTKFLQGQAYAHLADFVYLKGNCNKTIESLEEALDYFNEGNIPFQYYSIFQILGKVYWDLAKVEEKEENCKLSRNNYEKTLEFFTYERFPDYYNIINTNLERLEDFCTQSDDG